VSLFAVSGLRVQAGALRSGGQRRIALPESGPDPTDAAALVAAFFARRRELSGPRRLILAVFMTTLDDLRRHPVTTKPYAEAYRWCMSDDEGWPFAFVPLCETLGLDPAAVRARVCAAYGAPVTVHWVTVNGQRRVQRVLLPAHPVRAPAGGIL
jgi:hypothetical protein